MTTRAKRKAKAVRRNGERAVANQVAAASIGIIVERKAATPATVVIPRRKSGLEWLLSKGRISRSQFDTGEKVGAIFAEASRAEQPGRGDTLGMPINRPSEAPMPAPWRVIAIAERRVLIGAVMRLIPGEQGQAIVDVCRDVCYAGRTVRDLSRGDKFTAIRIEEQLKLGLALIKFGVSSLHEKKTLDVLDQTKALIRQAANHAFSAAPALPLQSVPPRTDAGEPIAPDQLASSARPMRRRI